MSISCQKDYSIKIVGKPLVYYKCEELVAPAVDQVAGLNLSTFAGAITSIPGIIGNGFDMSTWEGRTVNTSLFNFVGKDFMVRLWFQPCYDVNYPTSQYFSRLIEWDTQWELRHGLVAPFDMINWTLTVVPGPDVTVSSGTIPPGWHRIIAWYRVGVEAGLKIDNDPNITVATVKPLFSGAASQLTLAQTFGAPPPTQGIDEVGIWDRIWTATEMLNDWNGGAGRTYP